MPTYRRTDRVVLIHRGCIGLEIGDVGVVSDVQQTTGGGTRIRVTWDRDGASRNHAPRTLALESEYQAEAAPKDVGDYSKKLSLLGMDYTQAQSGLSGLVTFSDTLRDINETSLRLKALQKSVKHVVLYRSPEMSLYLSIHGKDVHLTKHTEGEVPENMSLPLAVVARLIDAFRNGQ